MKSVLKNKVVWITGASSGIGESLVYQLSECGAKLIISSRNKEKLETVKNNCINKQNIFILPLNLTDTSSHEVTVKNAIKAFNRIDYMIHNAGIAQKGLANETNMEIDYQVMNTNYFGTVALTKALLPHFIENKKGKFVVISSMAGQIGVPGRSAYSASKHALHGFFESLRAEVHQSNIEVTMVCPGFVNTNITINAFNGDGSKYGKLEKSHQLGISADVCASKIVECLPKNKKLVIIGQSEVWGIYINRYFPKFFSVIVRNHPIKKWRRVKAAIGLL